MIDNDKISNLKLIKGKYLTQTKPMYPYSTQNVYSYLFTQYDYQYHGFSPQVPSFTFAFKGSPSPPVHSQVKELPTDSDVKPSTPLPAKTFTCKDPEEGNAFPVSLVA